MFQTFTPPTLVLGNLYVTPPLCLSHGLIFQGMVEFLG